MAEAVREATTDTAARPGTDRRGRWVAILVGGLLLVPFVALVVWALRHQIWSAGDIGLTEVAVRSVGSSHTPLLGAYSRFHWHHPGPLLFYALAGPYRLLGSDGSALTAGGVIVNAVAVGVVAYVLWRRGGLGGLVTGAAVVALLLRGLGNDFLASAWNPAITVLPMLAFVLALWALLDDRPAMLVVMVVTGSFVVQAHVGTVGVVGGGLVAACTWLVARRRTHPVPGRLWIAAGATALVLWAAPMLEALRHGGGNLRSLAEFWTTSHGQVAGWSRAGRIVAAQFGFGAPWLTGHEVTLPFSGGLFPPWRFPIVAVVFLAALAVAWRRRDTASLHLGVITVGFTVVAWASVARIVDEPLPYLVRWVFLAGALAGLTVGWTVLDLVRTLPARVVTAVGIASTAVVVAIVVGLAVTSDATRTTFPRDEHVFTRLVGQLQRRAPHLETPVLVTSTPDLGSYGLSASVWAALLDAGLDARFPRAESWRVGESRTIRRADARTRLVAALGDPVTALRNDPRYRVVAEFDDLTPRQRAELDRIVPEFQSKEDAFRWAIEHPGLNRRATAIEGDAQRAAIFEVRD